MRGFLQGTNARVCYFGSEARLIFRRTFQALARVKGWKAADIIMALASVTL